jgi:hypothetical protein
MNGGGEPALIDQLAEYNKPKFKIGHGRRTGTVTVTSPALHHSVSDAALQTFLKAQIASNATLPKPGPNTLYFIYAPPGVRIIQGGSASCQAFCGYHNDIGGKIFYAVMPFPGCRGTGAARSAGGDGGGQGLHHAAKAPPRSPDRLRPGASVEQGLRRRGDESGLRPRP